MEQNTAAQPVPPMPAAIPWKQWPPWTKALRVLRTSADSGLGDTVERIIGPAQSKAFREWYRLTFDAECGCAERKMKWNAMYPYPTAETIPQKILRKLLTIGPRMLYLARHGKTVGQ